MLWERAEETIDSSYNLALEGLTPYNLALEGLTTVWANGAPTSYGVPGGSWREECQTVSGCRCSAFAYFYSLSPAVSKYQLINSFGANGDNIQGLQINATHN